MNKEKYTVKDFCEKYYDEKIDIFEKIMNPHYVSYEMKITICEKVIESSYYKKNNDGKTKRLHVNSPAKYMLYYLYLVKQYTNIEIDFSKSLEEFNLLNEYRLLDLIISNIPEKELKEFHMVLDMIESDVLQNEYETRAFISNQVERFGELVGVTLKPALNRFIEIVENMDEKTIDNAINKLQGLSGLKGKFNIMK